MKNFKVEKEFESNKLKCVVVMTSLGHRCGYVGVGFDHPTYNKGYGEIENLINVHGGLTYSATLEESANYPIPSNKTTWFGFDCGHYMDGKDLDKAKEYGLISDMDCKYLKDLERRYTTDCEMRSLEYVENECISLARQLQQIKGRAITRIELYREEGE
jgi:hypothetical protein